MKKFFGYFFPKGSDIRIRAFNVLAICGIVVSIITAFYNLSVGFGFLSFAECMSGVIISLGLMIYAKKTGNIRVAMILTVFVIFIGLFTGLYFTNGVYYGGVPYFFVFAVVFTAFMLDGVIMPVFVVIELVWYTIICLYSYYNPSPSFLASDDKVRVMDVIVCETIVAVSLAITMYYQIRVYREKQQELNAAIRAAEEANRAKSDFLAKMSHDIRTPLNTMLAMNEMIVANSSSARIREWVGDSDVSGRVLLSIIDDMLDLTKIEAGRMELLQQPWDVASLFVEAVKIWKPQTDKAGLDLSFDITPNVPHRLLGDEYAIRKITNNLLSNSVKYTKTGGICLNVDWDGELIIVVSDTGTGIAPEFLDKMFKPFERGVQDIYRETSGSGLGLAIVRELVDAMGGTVDCRSVVNDGTIFTIRLPQEECYDSEEEKERDEADLSGKGQVSRQFVAPDARILLVDDNPYNRKVVKGYLETTLIQLDDVESGSEALEMIDIRDYDLVLMDLRMPGMDGVETLGRIRKDYPDFGAPVVVLTADIMNGIEDTMLEQGFSGFLSKPISSTKLIETIRGYIPEKIVYIESEDAKGLLPSQMDHYQDILMTYGINLSQGLEFNAGNFDELLMRASLFEEYAEETMKGIEMTEPDEDYYIRIHSLKSVARGIGGYLLAQLAESVEYRHDDEFAKAINPIILTEYERVREGYRILRSSVDDPKASERILKV